MKNLTLGLLTLLTLSSCADPVLELPAKKEGSQKKVAGGNTAAACPDLNGIYAKKDAADKKIELYTNKKDAPKVSYAFDNKKEFILADGQAKQITIDGKKVSITVSCTATEVTTLLVQEGKKDGDTLKYTIDGDKKLKVEGTGALNIHNGYYAKEEAAPIVPGPVTTCPVIKGEYVAIDAQATTPGVGLKLESRAESEGKFSFSRGQSFLVADGVEQRVDSPELKGTEKATCDATSYTVEIKPDGQEATSKLKFTFTGDADLSVEGTGSSAPLSGKYKKK